MISRSRNRAPTLETELRGSRAEGPVANGWTHAIVVLSVRRSGGDKRPSASRVNAVQAVKRPEYWTDGKRAARKGPTVTTPAPARERWHSSTLYSGLSISSKAAVRRSRINDRSAKRLLRRTTRNQPQNPNIRYFPPKSKKAPGGA